MKDSYVFFYFTIMSSLISQKILHRAFFQIYSAPLPPPPPAFLGSVTEVSVAMLIDRIEILQPTCCTNFFIQQ
jgi:hypothetical protein